MNQHRGTSMPPIEWGEVQRVVLRGYLKLPWARFVFLRVKDPARAPRFFHAILEERSVRFGWGDRHEAGPAANLAFTREGLEALGVDGATLDGFSPEFVDGMAAPERARKLRDVGDNAPDHWLWGGAANAVHAVLMLYADTRSRLEDAVTAERLRFDASGLEEVRGPSGEELGTARPLPDRREHFGFTDGISQPRFREEPLGLRSDKTREADRLATGELLLGYENEASILPRSPILSPRGRERCRFSRSDHDFGKNGSYLVFRQLEQDVGAFWRAMSLACDGATIEERVHLAAKMIGRWPDGKPLVKLPPVGGVPRDPEDFDFARDDPRGEQCPFGAHIRRTNPRAVLANDPDLGLAKSKKHRILRRGRSYGEPFVEPLLPEALARAAESGTGNLGPRGLHFVGINADLANQFEFVQQTWANGTVFGGLHGEVDPLIGDPSQTGGRFTIPGHPKRRVCGIPRFVNVRGGAYFFVPSRAALYYLARLA
jgi:Dyp-type peroxidase family